MVRVVIYEHGVARLYRMAVRTGLSQHLEKHLIFVRMPLTYDVINQPENPERIEDAPHVTFVVVANHSNQNPVSAQDFYHATRFGTEGKERPIVALRDKWVLR
jgi:hypothetical protein